MLLCADGYYLSTIAGWGAYSLPREHFPEDASRQLATERSHVEVGFPMERPEPWAEWSEYCEDEDRPTETVYGYVPVGTVLALLELHGGAIRICDDWEEMRDASDDILSGPSGELEATS